MRKLTNYQLLRGINPNLLAGQRAIKVPAPYSGYGQYISARVANNPFYNLGDGSFTMYIRYLDLGIDGFYGQTQLLDKSLGGGSGWGFEKEGNYPIDWRIQFLTKAGGGVTGKIQDQGLAPFDGFFHSYTIVKSVTPLTADPTSYDHIRMFRDGVEVTNVVKYGTTANFASDNDVLFGGAGYHQLRGYIDCALFYSVALSDAEIAGLDSPQTRTDRGAKFIHEFNQIASGTTADICIDSSSVGQNSKPMGEPFQFLPITGLKTFASASTAQPPLNGHFTPTTARKVTGINRFDADIEADYSLDGVNWTALVFSGLRASNFPSFIQLDPLTLNKTLYLRGSNKNPTYLNGLEVLY